MPVKIALLNNEYLGMVRQQQQVQYHGNLVEVDLAGGPDYIKLAQAYGMPAWRVTDPTQLDDAIGAAMAYPGPAIIEFRVVRNEDVYPWVLSGTSLGDVLPDTPYEAERERVLASAGPVPKDGERPMSKHTLVATVEEGPATLNRVLSLFRQRVVRDREPEHRTHQRAGHHAPDDGRRRRARRPSSRSPSSSTRSSRCAKSAI